MANRILGPTGVPLGHDAPKCSAGGCEKEWAYRLQGNPAIPVEHRMTLYFCQTHFEAAGKPIGAQAR